MVNYAGSPVYNTEGHIILAVVTSRDVTKQKEVEAEREKLLVQLAKEQKLLRRAREQLEERVLRLKLKRTHYSGPSLSQLAVRWA